MNPTQAQAIINRAERDADAAGLKGGDKWALVAGILGGELRRLAGRYELTQPPEPLRGQHVVEVLHRGCELHVFASIDENTVGNEALDWDNAEVYAGPQEITGMLDSRELARIRELAAERDDFERGMEVTL